MIRTQCDKSLEVKDEQEFPTDRLNYGGVGSGTFWSISIRTKTVPESLLLELLKWVVFLKENPKWLSRDYASRADIVSTSLTSTQTRAFEDLVLLSYQRIG